MMGVDTGPPRCRSLYNFRRNSLSVEKIFAFLCGQTSCAERPVPVESISFASLSHLLYFQWNLDLTSDFVLCPSMEHQAPEKTRQQIFLSVLGIIARHDAQHIVELICVTSIQCVPIRSVSGTVPRYMGWEEEKTYACPQGAESLDVSRFCFPCLSTYNSQTVNSQPTSRKHPFSQKSRQG